MDELIKALAASGPAGIFIGILLLLQTRLQDKVVDKLDDIAKDIVEIKLCFSNK